MGMNRGPYRRMAVWTITTVSAPIMALAFTAATAAPAAASSRGLAPDVLALPGHVLAVADLPTVVNNATKWLVGILAVLATFFLTLGGARYLTAGGDPSEVERAKSSLRSAGIGYALALLAPVILNVLKSILGVK